MAEEEVEMKVAVRTRVVLPGKPIIPQILYGPADVVPMVTGIFNLQTLSPLVISIEQ